MDLLDPSLLVITGEVRDRKGVVLTRIPPHLAHHPCALFNRKIVSLDQGFRGGENNFDERMRKPALPIAEYCGQAIRLDKSAGRHSADFKKNHECGIGGKPCSVLDYPLPLEFILVGKPAVNRRDEVPLVHVRLADEKWGLWEEGVPKRIVVTDIHQSVLGKVVLQRYYPMRRKTT